MEADKSQAICVQAVRSQTAATNLRLEQLVNQPGDSAV